MTPARGCDRWRQRIPTLQFSIANPALGFLAHLHSFVVPKSQKSSFSQSRPFSPLELPPGRSGEPH
jgi:hypothetical protein